MVLDAKKKSEFILASKSPRRKHLLEQAGYTFEIIPSRIDETGLAEDKTDAAEYAKRLALAKAKEVAAGFVDRVVLAADTVVDFDGEIIGKAFDADHAELITRKLFSRPHKVITAVAIVRLCDNTELVENESTTVFPKKMSEAEITEHIKSGTWRDKAGAYAIQEGSDRFVEKIQGSITNVMGLPMELVERMLERIVDS